MLIKYFTLKRLCQMTNFQEQQISVQKKAPGRNDRELGIYV
jgi:hypothetical protein